VKSRSTTSPPPGIPSAYGQRARLDVIASMLLLGAPFLVFLRHYGYRLSQPEALICLAVLGVIGLLLGLVAAVGTLARTAVFAGLLTALADVQFDSIDGAWRLLLCFTASAGILWILRQHASRVLAIMAATLVVSTVLMPGPARAAARAPLAASSSSRGDLPFVLHIVLDEHIGIGGLAGSPVPEMAEEIRAFYTGAGFRLFPRAYSEHFATVRSLSSAFNFSVQHRVADEDLFGAASAKDQWALDAADVKWAVRRNAYLAAVVQRGYAVYVHQSNHLDLCGDTSGIVCDTYSYSEIAVLEEAPLPAVEKARIIAGVYLSRTNLQEEVRQHYAALRARVAFAGRVLPAWEPQPVRVGPLTSMSVLRNLVAEVGKAGAGQYLLAHVLIPHSPYVYDADCGVLPSRQWMDRVASDGSNTAEERVARYRAYARQLQCTYSVLGAVLDAIPFPLRDRAIVIVHGDHGSRITTTDPLSGRAARLVPSDYADSFSTLFAVRGPGLAAGSDERQFPLTCLLEALSTSAFQTIDDAGCPTVPTVFLTDSAVGSRAIAAPLPDAVWQP